MKKYALLVICSVLCALTGCGEQSAEDVYKKAMAAYEAEQYPKAGKLFEALLAQWPEHALARKARYQLGLMYFYKLNQPQVALKYLQELYAQSSPGKSAMNTLQLIGEIYDKSLNKCLDGVAAYRKIIQEYPKEVEASKAQFAIADCYFKLNNYQQAIPEYETLLTKYPESPAGALAQFRIANSYALMEAYDQAIKRYEALLRTGNLPAQLAADAKLELAYCYTQKEDFPTALKLYEELLALDAPNVVLDKKLIAEKKDQLRKRIAESEREPDAIDWKRKR